MPVPKNHATAEDYWNLPEGERAELIDGELWDLAAPSRSHQFIQGEIAYAIRAYIKGRKGRCQAYEAPFAVNLFADDTTFVEPDVSVVCDRSKLSDRGCEGAPDLVVEIVSPSSRSMDYRTKQSLYMSAGVREYLIVDPSLERTTVYYGEAEADPAPMVYPFASDMPVSIFPGLRLNLQQIVSHM